jgi:hypothetical protein
MIGASEKVPSISYRSAIPAGIDLTDNGVTKTRRDRFLENGK